MKDYNQLFNIKNQKKLNDFYNHIEHNEEMEKVYQEVTERNQTSYQKISFLSQTFLDKCSQISGIIGMIIFAILFILGGSLILGTLLSYITIGFIDYLKDFYNWTCQVGMGIYDVVLASVIGMSGNDVVEGIKDFSTNIPITCGFSALGMMCLLSVFFAIIYIISFFKKQPDKSTNQNMSLENAYTYLQVDENDDFAYIRRRFLHKLKRRHKDYFARYSQAYLMIFEAYQPVEGKFRDLNTMQKIQLIFHTIMNTLKNILGSFSKPVYASVVILIAYSHIFIDSEILTLENLLKALPLGNGIVFLLDQSYQIINQTAFSAWLLQYRLEYAKVISFCICMTMICFVISVLRHKIVESIRQYKRRQNYYLKINQGIYDKNHPYTKCYLYTTQFVVLAFFILFVVVSYWLSIYS